MTHKYAIENRQNKNNALHVWTHWILLRWWKFFNLICKCRKTQPFFVEVSDGDSDHFSENSSSFDNWLGWGFPKSGKLRTEFWIKLNRYGAIYVRHGPTYLWNSAPNVKFDTETWQLSSADMLTSAPCKIITCATGNRTSTRLNFGTRTSAQISKTFINFGTN